VTSMEVTYQIKPQEMAKAYQSYFRDCPDGQIIIRSVFFFFLLIFTFIFLILSIFVGADNGRLAGTIIYILCNAVYFFLANRIIRNWSVKRQVKKLDKDRLHEDVTISLTDTSITVKGVNATFCVKWKGIESIEKTDLFLLFKPKTQHFFVPSYAFATREKCEDFYKLANQYCENNRKQGEYKSNGKPLSKGRWLIAALLFPLLGLVILLSALESQASRPLKKIEVVQDAISFWKEALQKDFPIVDYRMYTTDGFKVRIPEKEWQDILDELKHRVGKVKDLEPLSYEYWRDPKKIEFLFVSFSMNTRSDTAKIVLKILGEKDSIYILSFFEEGAWWKLNGFDVITTEGTKVTVDSYSTEEDRMLFPDEPENSRELINDAEEASVLQYNKG